MAKVYTEEIVLVPMPISFPLNSLKDLIQYTEDALHGSTANTAQTVAPNVCRLWSDYITITLFNYKHHEIVAVGYFFRDRSIVLDAKMSYVAKEVIREKEPQLCAVLSQPDVCVCQTISGIIHTHD